MTGPCSGAGTGTPKAGLSLTQYVGPAAIGGALASLSGWQGAAVGASIGLITYELSTFCPSGPPAMPTFNAGDITNLLLFPYLPTSAGSLQKFRDFVSNIFWPILCDCSSGTSTLGAPSTFPTDGAQSAGPLAAPVNPNCDGLKNDLGDGPWSATDDTWHAGDTSAPYAYIWFPTSQPTSYRLTAHNTTRSGAGVTFTLKYKEFVTYTAGSAPAGSGVMTLAPGASSQVTITPTLAGARFLLLYVDAVTGTGTASLVGSTLEAFCGGATPGGQQQACCPPDAATQAQLDAILALVTLIQRQAVPFAYVQGTDHAGLSGSGSFAVQGLIGCAVDVTTLPSSYGRASGTPEELFDLGFVTLGTADGYEVSRRIDHDGTLIFPQLAGVFTVLGYTIAPGVVVSIRELTREP